MRFFTTCTNNKVHFPTVKQVRHYYDDKTTLKCKCGGLGYDAEFLGKKSGDTCKRCNTVYKYAKLWKYKCPECSGGE